MNEKEFRKVAEEHWRFLERWLHIIYVDALVHGYKQEVEQKLREGLKQ
jgi:hypothetical protein